MLCFTTCHPLIASVESLCYNPLRISRSLLMEILGWPLRVISRWAQKRYTWLLYSSERLEGNRAALSNAHSGTQRIFQSSPNNHWLVDRFLAKDQCHEGIAKLILWLLSYVHCSPAFVSKIFHHSFLKNDRRFLKVDLSQCCCSLRNKWRERPAASKVIG